MMGSKTITASVEGAEVIINEKLCHLQEYNFAENRWYPKDHGMRPLPRARAEQWLAGWNDVDRFAALTLLTAPVATD